MAKSNRDLVTDLFDTFLSRQPTDIEMANYTERLDSGFLTRAWVANDIMNLPGHSVAAEAISRLYLAAFNRIPDFGGLKFWLGVHRNGAALTEIADIFTRSPEFALRYGEKVADSTFVDLLYNNALGRKPDAGGKAHWENLLKNGMSRGEVVNNFAQSIEHQNLTASKVAATLLYTAVVDRVPTDEELVAIPADSEQLALKAAEASGGGASGGPAVTYSGNSFTESQNNDGTISNTVKLTVSGDSFKGAVGAVLGKITNVPAGLTASLTKADDSTAALTLKGTAKDHAASNSIGNLTVTLDNTSFTSGKAANISGVVKSDIKVSFIDLPLKEVDGTLTTGGVLANTLAVDLSADKVTYGLASVALVSGSIANVKNVDFSELKPASSSTNTKLTTTTVSIKGDSQDNVLTAAGYATTIDGGKGADTITCGSAKDTIVFASTASGNGADLISGFTIGTGGDVLNFSAFLNRTGVSNVTALNLGVDPLRSWNNGDVIVIQGHGLDATVLANVFNDTTIFSVPKAGKAVIITCDIIGDTNIWYLVNQTTPTVIDSSEITLVGTIKDVNNLELAGFSSANFA